METMVATIGITIIKMGVLGSLAASIITGVKWFGKYEPNFKKKNSSMNGGQDDEPNHIEHLRKQASQRS